jgi:hypothetical protein
MAMAYGAPMPFVPGGQQGGGGGGYGYTGLQGIISALSGPHGINASQYAAMGQGANGADGMAIGGMHGAFNGLSPYAVHFLATSGLLDQNKATTVPTTGADGQPLTGTALLMANLQNQLNAGQPSTYSLAPGIGESQLQSLFAGGMQGHSAYAHGYDAQGAIHGAPQLGDPAGVGGPPPGQGPGRNAPIVGHGLHGNVFHNLAAYHASKAYQQARQLGYGHGATQGGNPPRPHPAAGGTVPERNFGPDGGSGGLHGRPPTRRPGV